MLVHRRVTPSSKFAGTHLYTWVERGTMRVKYLAQEHNAVPRPGLEPGPPDPESSALTIRPPRLPSFKIALKSREPTDRSNLSKIALKSRARDRAVFCLCVTRKIEGWLGTIDCVTCRRSILTDVYLPRKIAQFRYFNSQPKTIDTTTRLRGINPTNSIIYSPEPLTEVYCFRLNLIHRNWAIASLRVH